MSIPPSTHQNINVSNNRNLKKQKNDFDLLSLIKDNFPYD